LDGRWRLRDKARHACRYALAIIRSAPSARRFPPPWIVEEHNDACFIVKDATGQALGYF